MNKSIHQPCHKCGSSDACTYFLDTGVGSCFSCGANYKLPSSEEYTPHPIKKEYDMTTVIEIGDLPTASLSDRGISQEVCEHFGVRVEFNADRSPKAHFYPYTKKGVVSAYKQRTLPKSFRTIGDFTNIELFGQNVAGSGRTVVITEGEIDALTVAQCTKQKYNKIYPVVSLPSATGMAALANNLEFLHGYDTVVLMFDQDEAGQKAVEEASNIIGFKRVKIAQLPEKDPNETAKIHGSQAIIDAIFSARTYSPAGLVSGESLWDAFVSRQETTSIPYPPCINGVNEKTGGMRLNEISLFTSGTGSGKTSLMNEIILHLIETTDVKVGIASLEESPGAVLQRLLAAKVSTNLNTTEVPQEELYEASKGITDRIVVLDHQGSVADGGLLTQLKKLVSQGCTHIILDHITIAVSEGAEGLEGNAAIDRVMSDLLKFVTSNDVWLGVVSHLRKSGGGSKSFEEGRLASLDDIKGSGSIKQISFDIICFARDMSADTEEARNQVSISVLKTRNGNGTGPAGQMIYNADTTRLSSYHGDLFNGQA